MNQRFQVLQELGEQFEQASLAAELAGARPHRPAMRSPRIGLGLRAGGRRLWPLVGAAGVAVAAALVVAITLLSTGTSPAYAGWARVPTTASTTSLKSAVRRCYKVDPNGNNGLGHPVLTEARGRSTALIHVIDRTVYMCLYDSNFSEVTSDSMGPLRAAPGLDQLSVPYGVWGGGGSGRLPKRLVQELKHRPITRATFIQWARFNAGDGYGYWALGQAGSGITAVTFAFAGHKAVTATVEHGWYFAWWPWMSDPTSVTVKTSTGTVTAAMRNAWPGGYGSRPYPVCKPGSNGCMFVKNRAVPTRTTSTTSTTTPGARAVDTATQQCRAFALSGDTLPADAFTGQPVLTEVHGIFTAALNVTRQRVYACLVGGDEKNIHAFFEEDIASFGEVRPAPGPDQLSVPYRGTGGGGTGRSAPAGKRRKRQTSAQILARLNRMSGGGYGPYTLGEVGSHVSRVRFAFANGKTVAATVENGWYFAWWPWLSKPTGVTVTTRSGTITSPLTGTNPDRGYVAPRCKPGSQGCVFAKT
jgi:hypothetical protein